MATGEDRGGGSHGQAGGIAWDEVARLYDTYVTATHDLPFYLREAGAADDVLELMCGTGRISLPLAEASAHLTCVDNSTEMLSVLRDKLAQRSGLASRVHIVQMDVRELALGQQYDLVLLPFQSFAELILPADQQQALRHIHGHLRDGGRFICTLHNPAVRRRTADGMLRLVGQFPMHRSDRTLLVWALAAYDPETHLVEGMQFYEEYGVAGTLERKRMLAMRFALLESGDFEALATSAGFRVATLYGDYDCAPFEESTSPFMIWVLEKH